MGFSIRYIVDELERAYDVSEWWPKDSSFEVAVGAILTQRTSWKNVESAVANLKSHGMMTPEAISSCEEEVLHMLVRPSGFYRQKSRYLRAFSSHLVDRYAGDVRIMSGRPLGQLRGELLELDGIGPETADTILLYALGMPSFVVDAYSGRDYGHVKKMFEDALDQDVKALSNAHAAVVTHCKERCKVRQDCMGCPFIRKCPSKAHDDG
jgi:endonuclease-3 related protein